MEKLYLLPDLKGLSLPAVINRSRSSLHKISRRNKEVLEQSERHMLMENATLKMLDQTKVLRVQSSYKKN